MTCGTCTPTFQKREKGGARKLEKSLLYWKTVILALLSNELAEIAAAVSANAFVVHTFICMYPTDMLMVQSRIFHFLCL